MRQTSRILGASKNTSLGAWVRKGSAHSLSGSPAAIFFSVQTLTCSANEAAHPPSPDFPSEAEHFSIDGAAASAGRTATSKSMSGRSGGGREEGKGRELGWRRLLRSGMVGFRGGEKEDWELAFAGIVCVTAFNRLLTHKRTQSYVLRAGKWNFGGFSTFG